MSLNLAVLLTESAKKFPAEPAVILDAFKLNYAQLNALSSQFANALVRAGIKQQDKVVLMLPNIPQFPIAYYGALKMGAVVVPINVLLKNEEIEYLLKDSEATAMITFEGFAGEAVSAFQRVASCKHLVVVQMPGSTNPLPQGENIYSATDFLKDAAPKFDMVPTNPDDTAVILYTSGTTGKPKGAELTHFTTFYTAQFAADKLAFIKPGDVMLVVLPMFHVFGQTSMMNCGIAGGAALSLVPRFEPTKVLEVMQRDKATHFGGVPTMYFALLHHPERKNYDLSSLRLCVSGGAAIPVEVLHSFEKEFNVAILEGYGLSETAALATFNVLDKPRKPGSIGIPIWGVELRLVDANDQDVPPGEMGEIIMRGFHVMKAYYKNPNATEDAMRNQWFHTGDIARADEEGYLYIVDRVKDMIIRGGYNVYPREIEEVLYQHPAVREAAVVGVPDPKMGEEIKAFVSLKSGANATTEEIVEFVKNKVAAYKYPRECVIVDELPKGATGKILKRELKDIKA